MSYKIQVGKFSKEEMRNHFIRQLIPYLKKGETIGSHRQSPDFRIGGSGFIFYGICSRYNLFMRSWHIKLGRFCEYTGEEGELEIDVYTPRGLELATKLSELIKPNIFITLIRKMRNSSVKEIEQ